MKKETRITVKTRNESTSVGLSEIVVVEKCGRKVCLVMPDRTIYFYDSIKNIEPLLGENFLEISKGCIINLDYLKSAREGKLIFENGHELMVSERAFSKAKIGHFTYHRPYQLEKVKEKSENYHREK